MQASVNAEVSEECLLYLATKAPVVLATQLTKSLLLGTDVSNTKVSWYHRSSPEVMFQ